MDRAFSVLHVKALDEEKRVIRGIATTPAPDRVNDVVVSTGVTFKNPMPLLWMHAHDKPVGTVRFDPPTEKGITFEATLPKIDTPGILRDRVTEAWDSVKAGVVTAVSIGFRVLDNAVEPLKNGGLKYLKTEVFELSLCTIPMHPGAVITSFKHMAGDAPPTPTREQIEHIKSIDTAMRAASGIQAHGSQPAEKSAPPPGESGTQKRPASGGFFYARLKGNDMNVQEQLDAAKAKLSEVQKSMQDIMKKAADEGRTLDADEADKYDEHQRNVADMQKHIGRLEVLEKSLVSTATPVRGQSEAEASASRGLLPVHLKSAEKLEPGIAFARYAMCLTKAKGNHEMAFRLAEKHFPKTENVVRVLKAQAEGANLQEMMVLKATVAAGTSTETTWAAPLVYAQTFMGDFISYLRPRTLIGQAQFRPVPFNVRIGGQTSGGTAGWVGQGRAKPVTKFDFNATTVPFTKVAAIAVITQELARFSDPSAEMLVRDSLADAVIARVDTDLFDPDLAAVANVAPAGLLNGVSPIAMSSNAIDYSDPASVRTAIALLWAPWDSTYLGARPAYYTTPAVARQLALSREALGTPAFPGVSMTGGTLDGVPLRVSQYLANNGGSGGAPFILVDESEIYLADDGSVTLDASDVASIEMNDAPTQAAGTPTAASLVSMWQTNSIAFRAERFIWWGPRRSGALQWIDGMPTS